MVERVWECKIGGDVQGDMPKASDSPMRDAVFAAFKEVTGADATFCFSGWGAKVNGLERSVIENRDPTPAECDVVTDKCDVPPTGWECTRKAGHEGQCAAVLKKPWVAHDDVLARRYVESLGLVVEGDARRIDESEVEFTLATEHKVAFEWLDQVSCQDDEPGAPYLVHAGQGWDGEAKGYMDGEWYAKESKNMSRSITLTSHLGRKSTLSLKYLPENEEF